MPPARRRSRRPTATIATAIKPRIDAPLSRNTAEQYDALNRLSQITDPNSGITKLAYDANDNLASVIDPRSLTTSYTHNGFGEVTKLVSPDTGTTTTPMIRRGILRPRPMRAGRSPPTPTTR